MKLEGRYIEVPGFMDLHAHLREPGFEESETLATGAHAALHGGFTTVCAMPNTDPAIDTPALVKEIYSRAPGWAEGARVGRLPRSRGVAKARSSPISSSSPRPGRSLSPTTATPWTTLISFAARSSTPARLGGWS